MLRSVSQKFIVCCVCLMDTTCPYGAVATELSLFGTWQVACISRVDVDMQCCCFLLAKDLMTCWHCWSWTSTRRLSQCFCQVLIFNINCRIITAEFLTWIGSFLPFLFVIQHLQVTNRDGATALWCLKHSNVLMCSIISRTDICFSRDKDVFLHTILFKRGWYFLLWANTSSLGRLELKLQCFTFTCICVTYIKCSFFDTEWHFMKNCILGAIFSREGRVDKFEMKVWDTLHIDKDNNCGSRPSCVFLAALNIVWNKTFALIFCICSLQVLKCSSLSDCNAVFSNSIQVTWHKATSSVLYHTGKPLEFFAKDPGILK